MVAISRPARGKGGKDELLAVEWEAILLGTDSETNYLLRPDDKVVVTFDSGKQAPDSVKPE